MTFWILAAVVWVVIFSASWGLWGLIRREIDRRIAVAVLRENQIADLKRKAREKHEIN